MTGKKENQYELTSQDMEYVKTIARKLSKEFHLSPSDQSELISEGHLALMDAREKFNPSRGASFRTFASKVIENRMRSYLRKERVRGKKTQSIDEETGEESPPLADSLIDHDGRTPLDMMVSKEEAKSKQKLVRDSLKELKPRERAVLQGNPKSTYKKKALRLGVSPERIRQIKKKACRKVKYLSSGDFLGDLQRINADPKIIKTILVESGLCYEKELPVMETIRGPEELMRKIKGDCENDSDKSYETMNSVIMGVWDRVKHLKRRGNHIVFPSKTKPKREDVFVAVSYLLAYFKSLDGKPHWDFIERILYPYCNQVFKGGNLEDWYRKREREDFNYFLKDRKTRDGILVHCLDLITKGDIPSAVAAQFRR